MEQNSLLLYFLWSSLCGDKCFQNEDLNLMCIQREVCPVY